MRKLITCLATVLLAVVALAQVPEKMSYQAVIRDNSDALLTNVQIGVQISILQGSVNGTLIYTEIHTPTTNSNGLITLEIGTGTTGDDFSLIDWGDGPYFLKTETDPSGGTNYSISNTSQLLTVPYAFHANSADVITGELPEADPVFSSSPSADLTEGDIDNIHNLSGVNSGDQDLSNLALQVSLEDTAYAIRNELISEETDPVFDASIAKGITDADTAYWNDHFSGDYTDLNNAPTNVSEFTNDAGYLTSFTEVDGSTTNELQTLSTNGDTIFLSNGNYIVLPGLAYISELIPSPVVYNEFTTGNQIDLTQVSTGWTYTSVDFVNGIITLNAGSDASVPQFLSDDGGANYGYLRFNATTDFMAYTVSSATQTVAEGSTIDNSIAFSTSTSEISGNFANWGDVSNVFIPLHLTIDSEVHYGYMEVSFVDNPGLLTIHAIAYNSNAGEAITAGDTGD